MKQKTVTGTGNCLCPHSATQHRPLFSCMIEARKLTAGEAIPQQKRRVTAPREQPDEAGNPTESGCRENSKRDSKQTQCAAKPNAARCNKLCSALRWPMQRTAPVGRAVQNIRQADERGILLGPSTARSCFANSVQAETGIQASQPGCKHHHFQYFQSNRLSALRSTFLSSLEKKLMPVRASTLSTVTA